MIWNIRTTLSSVPGGPLVSSGFPLSLLLLAALVLVLSFLFCGLFLRLALQYLVRKRDEVSGCDEGGGGGDTETLEDTVVTPSAPPLLTSDSSSCAPLPPPPTYSEAVASSPPPKLGSQHPAHPHVQPPPYSLLIGPSGPCLARSYTANTSWHRIAWQDTSRCWRKGELHISFFHHRVRVFYRLMFPYMVPQLITQFKWSPNFALWSKLSITDHQVVHAERFPWLLSFCHPWIILFWVSLLWHSPLSSSQSCGVLCNFAGFFNLMPFYSRFTPIYTG